MSGIPDGAQAGSRRPGSRSSVLGRVPARAWGALVLVVLAVVLIAENREPTAIRLLVPVVEMPLWAALTAMFVAGILVGMGLRRRRR